jgi:protein SCO1
MASRRFGAHLLCWLGLVAAAGCGESGPRFHGEAVEPLAAAPELAGVNWDGERFRLADLDGRVAIVFFGYTFCPDVCPFTLAKLKQLYARLGDRAGDLAVVFVSVDPRRDSVEKLASYVPNFDRRFYGLRLEADELAAVQEDWDVIVQYGQPREGPGTDSFYYVDHTGTYFVVDRDGNLRLTYPPDVDVETLLPDIEALLAL